MGKHRRFIRRDRPQRPTHNQNPIQPNEVDQAIAMQEWMRTHEQRLNAGPLEMTEREAAQWYQLAHKHARQRLSEGEQGKEAPEPVAYYAMEAPPDRPGSEARWDVYNGARTVDAALIGTDQAVCLNPTVERDMLKRGVPWKAIQVFFNGEQE